MLGEPVTTTQLAAVSQATLVPPAHRTVPWPYSTAVVNTIAATTASSLPPRAVRRTGSFVRDDMLEFLFTRQNDVAIRVAETAAMVFEIATEYCGRSSLLLRMNAPPASFKVAMSNGLLTFLLQKISPIYRYAAYDVAIRSESNPSSNATISLFRVDLGM